MAQTRTDRLVVCASHSPGKERDVDEHFGRQFRSGLAAAAENVRLFDPDVVVLFGGDHRRAFRHVVPAFGVALSASILAEGRHPAGPLAVPTERARALAENLRDNGFDIAVCRDIALDHGFALAAEPGSRHPAGGGQPVGAVVYEPVREWITGMAVATFAVWPDPPVPAMARADSIG